MKWSRYNYIFDSDKYGQFIYNSTTNSFVKISYNIYNEIITIKDWNIELNNFPQNFKELLIGHNIIVDDKFDVTYFNKKKYLRLRSSFSKTTLNLAIATTTNCNFKCAYCYEDGIIPLIMTEETENAIIKFINKSDSKRLNICWYGGEPLMNFNSIVRLTNQLSKINKFKDISYSMITNGYFLDMEKCQFFVDKNIKSIQITIDGREDMHNKSRVSKNEKPSYKVILRNIDEATDLLPNCIFAIRVNISLKNREEYPLLREELMDRWKDKRNIGIYFSFIEDYGLCEHMCLNSQDKLAYIKELKEKYNIPYVHIFPTSQSGVCVANRENDFVISADGSLYKCLSDIGKKDRIVGNVFDEKNITNYNLIAEYAINQDPFNDDKCINCFLMPVCYGGCPVDKYNNEHSNQSHNKCPYELENIDLLLELMYENYLK